MQENRFYLNAYFWSNTFLNVAQKNKGKWERGSSA